MNDTKWTKGPWKAEAYNNRCDDSVRVLQARIDALETVSCVCGKPLMRSPKDGDYCHLEPGSHYCADGRMAKVQLASRATGEGLERPKLVLAEYGHDCVLPNDMNDYADACDALLAHKDAEIALNNFMQKMLQGTPNPQPVQICDDVHIVRPEDINRCVACVERDRRRAAEAALTSERAASNRRIEDLQKEVAGAREKGIIEVLDVFTQNEVVTSSNPSNHELGSWATHGGLRDKILALLPARGGDKAPI